jgi:hypothetical protein
MIEEVRLMEVPQLWDLVILVVDVGFMAVVVAVHWNPPSHKPTARTEALLGTAALLLAAAVHIFVGNQNADALAIVTTLIGVVLVVAAVFTPARVGTGR